MNSIQLIGRLTRDPELRSTQSGANVCELRLAVPRRRGRGGEDRGAVFIDVTAFGALADSCAEFLDSGRRVAVSGRLELDEWKADDGEPRRRHKVVADAIAFLDAPKRGEDDNGEPGEPAAE